MLEQGDTALEANGTRVHDQKIDSPLGPRWIAWREGLVRNDAGEPAEMQSVGRDVTDRTESERALAEARDQADAANRAKSRFLAMASHEIRTPLNGIIGMSGLLMDTPLTPEQVTYARAVKTSGDALLSLIEELLDYSKIEAGKIDLEHRPFALAALIEDITELLAPRAQAKGIEIAAYVDERLPARSGRRRRAAAAGAAQSRRQRHQVHRDRRRRADRRARHLAQRDQLPGARHRHRHRAGSAERAFSASSSRPTSASRASYGGTGLGLSISERIVKRMGGRIALESTAGRRLDLRGVGPARRRRTGARSSLRGARSLRPVDHAGGAAEHRGLADRAAAAALGRADLHGVRRRGRRRRCCPSGPGTRC